MGRPLLLTMSEIYMVRLEGDMITPAKPKF